MAKKSNQEDEVLVDVTQSISKVEKFFEENRKAISTAAIAVFAIVAGYIGYVKFYQEPLETEAQEMIYHAQHWYEVDSFTQAINGMGDKLGFLDVAADYSSTNAGNMANYYAGISYLRLGEYENAIRLLDEFHTDEPVLSVIAKGSIGDAFMELKQMDEALEYYESAVSVNSNDFVVPFYLLKAGLTAELNGNNESALKFFNRIKSEFPDSRQGLDIDRYIGRIEAKNVMATAGNNLSKIDPDKLPSATGMRFACVVSEWNEEITSALYKGASEALMTCGAARHDVIHIPVPGTVEITFAAKRLCESENYDAIIAIGNVIQGETKHFDYVCQSITHGITELNLQHQTPVIFCVLTDNNIEQSRARSGGIHGNKGVEAAVAALKMAGLKKIIR